MYKKIRNTAVYIFIVAVVILTLISVLAIWDVFGNDTLWKSFATVGVLGFAAIVTIIAAKQLESREAQDRG